MKTFLEVGTECGLTNQTLERYVTYMTRRWIREEEMQCQTGYAAEWAGRFRRGVECGSSDLEGKSVLEDIDNDS